MTNDGSRRRKKNSKNNDKNLLQEKRVATSNCEITNYNNIDNDDGVDMISKLSDDILISIISRLTVAEAVCTSILSTRWRGLHKYITRLDFSPTSKQLQAFKEEEEFRLHKVGHDNRLFEEELIRKCTNVIDRTLDSNNGGSILEEIRFYLPWFQITTCNESWPIESGLVERWLDFAFSKQVQTIHLHINTVHLRVPFSYSNFTSINKTLKEISLNGIDLDDEGLRLLLSNFVALERLSIERSDKLSDVHILGDHLIAPKLKHLNISACWDIKFIEIRDMTNFESLRLYHLPLIGYELVLENLPRFVELDTNCRKTEIEILSRGNVISEQLVKLKLSTYIFDVYNDYMPLARMGKLKHVELEFSIYTDRSFHELVRFMDTCPCLQKLEIKMKSRWGGEHYCMEVVKKGSNDHLKRVKLSGLEGCSCEMKFGLYIVGKATELKELVMEICPVKTDESRRRARALVRKCFQPILPDSVNFVIV